MRLSYPALFDEDDGGYSVIFPDLNHLATCGDTYDEAVSMAVDCLAGFIETCKQFGEEIKSPSDAKTIKHNPNETVVVISVDPDEYAKTHFNKPVKKTLTIPKWLNDACKARGIIFSKVLQEALKHEIGIS